jgi:DNA polymerase III subunit gamma/tau
MDEIQLNLARKWRAQCFDQLIGQTLSVKMLKNSLYRSHLFPVYLFWGQRGTGKTSMARVFSSAVNCSVLPQFQKEPKNCAVPCLKCSSCLAMAAGKHPDFIEIDAASHTGVDNVRQIIDSASLLPIMGRKKIYLIDEAHMLSKAAFNALLKILEEPPVSALFILATTDPQKIIETVRSRCFQVCFKPVDVPEITSHLKNICNQESIYADKDALALIAHESEGSVRDAINMLERVRFAQGRVTSQAVLSLLGHIDDVHLIQLLEVVCRHDGRQLMKLLSELQLERYDADYIWKRLGELLRMMVWARYGLPITLVHDQADLLVRVAKACPIVMVAEMLQLLYSHERLFAKTSNKHLLLEMLWLKMCQWGNTNNEPTMNPVSQQTATPSVIADTDGELDDDDEQEDDQDDSDDEYEDENSALKNNSTSGVQCWQKFIKQIELMDDPLMISVFKNGQFKNFDVNNARVDLAFAQQFVFFQDWLASSTTSWKPKLDEAFGCIVDLNSLFTQEIEPVTSSSRPVRTDMHTAVVKETISEQKPVEKKYSQPFMRRQNPWQKSGVAKKPIIDVSDAALWPKAALLLKYFPGVVREQ